MAARPFLPYPDPFEALVLLILLIVVGAWCLARPGYWAAALLTVLGFAWLFWNEPFEGRVLYSINQQHGVTESDLLSVAAFAIAAGTVWRVRFSGSRDQNGPAKTAHARTASTTAVAGRSTPLVSSAIWVSGATRISAVASHSTVIEVAGSSISSDCAGAPADFFCSPTVGVAAREGFQSSHSSLSRSALDVDAGPSSPPIDVMVHLDCGAWAFPGFGSIGTEKYGGRRLRLVSAFSMFPRTVDSRSTRLRQNRQPAGFMDLANCRRVESDIPADYSLGRGDVLPAEHESTETGSGGSQ